MRVFEDVKDRMTLMPITKEFSWQSKLEYPVTNNPLTVEFWHNYKKLGFKLIARKYWDYSVFRYNKRKYTNIIFGLLSKILHKLLRK